MIKGERREGKRRGGGGGGRGRRKRGQGNKRKTSKRYNVCDDEFLKGSAETEEKKRRR